MRWLFLGVALSLVALGCGQKGILYLREAPPPGVKPPGVQNYKPVPYPKDASKDAPQGSQRDDAVEK